MKHSKLWMIGAALGLLAVAVREAHAAPGC